MKKAIFTCMVMACLLPIGGWAQTTGTLDFTEAESSSSGDGYSWDNGTLTLEGLNLTLENSDGIIVPDGTTILLRGNNKIQNNDGIAINGKGALTIKGDGGSLDISTACRGIQSSGPITISNNSVISIEVANGDFDGSAIDAGGNGGSTLELKYDLTLENSKLTVLVKSDDEGLYMNDFIINNSELYVTTEDEEAVCPDGTVIVRNNSKVVIDSAKDGIEAGLTVENSEVEITSHTWACVNGATTVINSNLNLITLGTDPYSDVCFDVTDEKIIAQDSYISTTAQNGGSIFSSTPPMESMLTKATTLLPEIPESVVLNNSLFRANDKNNHYTLIAGEYKLTTPLIIAEGETLFIPEDATLTIPTGLSLTNNGTTNNNGTLYIESGATLDGTKPVGGTVIDNNPSRPEITYYSLTIIPSEGATLTSRHDKKTVKEGGSFTLSLTIDESYAGAEPTVYVKRGRGEWTALEIDTVSGYYQIRDVRNDITVKVSGDGIYPVGNETVAPQQARIYASGSKIVVVTPQPTEVQIISMSGAVVAACQVNGQQEFGNLANGIYIIRAGNETIKLHVAQ